MRNHILRFVIVLSGLMCLYGLLAIRFLPLYNFVARDKLKQGYWDYNKYGELYYYSTIKYFREDMPQTMKKFQFKEKHPDLPEAQILTFGDSYLDFSKHIQLSERLQDSLNIPVFYEYSTDPLYFLSKEEYENNETKTLIYVRNERWIPITFGENSYFQTYIHEHENSAKWRIKNLIRKSINFLFEDRTDELLRSLINRSYVLSEMNSFISTIKFDWFGYISSYTPVYSLEGQKPWLFFHDQVNEEKTSFYYHHTDTDISAIADRIDAMKNELKKQHDLELLIMVVPAKYTIHHTLVSKDSDYNGLIPRLQQEFEKRDINYVDLYKTTLSSEQNMYYGTDDHWTEEGVRIATNMVIKELKDLGIVP